jgi:hypothetical protein
MMLNQNHRQSIEPYREHDVFDRRPCLDSNEHDHNPYDEDTTDNNNNNNNKNDTSFVDQSQVIFVSCVTFDDVKINMVDFSRIVRDADNCDRRRSSLRS